jgi:hypothetical protein
MRADRATLEKLSIVRILPYAPDLSLRIPAGGSVGGFSCRFSGSACPGSQENLSQRPHGYTEGYSTDNLTDGLEGWVEECFEQRFAGWFAGWVEDWVEDRVSDRFKGRF